MPTTEPSPQTVETVEIAPGVHLPTQFSEAILGRVDDGGYETWRINVRIDPDERKPRLVSYEHHLYGAPTLDEISDERIRPLLPMALRRQAERIAGERMMRAMGKGYAIGSGFRAILGDDPELPYLDDDEIDRVGAAAAALATPKLGRRPVTDERKLEILDLYRTKGIAATKEITGLAESTIRHHLTDARRIEAARTQAGGVK